MDSSDIDEDVEGWLEEVIEGLQQLDLYHLKLLKYEVQNRINDAAFEEINGEGRR